VNLVANLEPPEQIMPAIRSLHNPAMGSPTRVIANCGFFAAARNVRNMPASGDRAADVGLGMPLIKAQVLTDVPRRRPLYHPAVEQCSQLRLVMIVGSRQRRIQRDAVVVGLDVAFGAKLGPIRGVLANAIPPSTGAQAVAESTACHCQSMPLRSSYCYKHSRHKSWNTPERTHAWKWRWAVEPEPYSRGIIFHWHPIGSTYRTPLKMTRLGLGRRPPLGPIGWSGISGKRIVQPSSGTSRQPGCRFSGWRFSRRRRRLEQITLACSVRPACGRLATFNRELL
jgi:hypothetical protein